MSDQSTATLIAQAVADDLADWLVSADVQRWYIPIYDVSQLQPGKMYVTVYEDMSEIERATRAKNDETTRIYVAVQERFTGAIDIRRLDELRYELEQIANRYLGKNYEIDGIAFRAQEARFGSVNDPELTWRVNAYFGVVEFSFIQRAT